MPISTISISLVGFEVEVDHVARLARGLRTCVHRHADIGLGERRRVIGAVAAHRDQLALRLLVADQAQLLLRRRLGEKIVNAGFGRDRRRGHRVVAGDHDGADAHAAQLGETLANAALDDVFKMNDAEQFTVLGDGERRAARFGDGIGDRRRFAGGVAAHCWAQCLHCAARADR